LRPMSRATVLSPNKISTTSIRTEFGPIFELLAITSASLYRDHHAYYELGRSWFAKVAKGAPETFGTLRSFGGGSVMIWDHLYGLAIELGGDHGIDPFIEHLARMDAGSLRLELLGRRYRNVQRRVGIDRIEDAAAGNATAQRDFLRLAWPEESAWQTGIRQILKNPPPQTQAELVTLLRNLERDLRPSFEPWLPALEAEAADKRRAATEMLDPLDIVRAAIDIPYTPPAEVNGVVLIPSFVIRPQVYYFEFEDLMLFQYPVSDRVAESIGAGPPDRLARMAAALGDRGRLRILAALKQGGMTLKDLGEELSLPRSTLRHHVAILYSAGLLRPMQTGDGFNGYQLREEAATDFAELVDKFLRGPS
jgi:DNA-binding transcriptional ArsR family regulator